MNDKTENVQDLTEEELVVYKEAADLHKEGKTDEAIALIKDKVGEEQAEEVKAIIEANEGVEGTSPVQAEEATPSEEEASA